MQKVFCCNFYENEMSQGHKRKGGIYHEHME